MHSAFAAMHVPAPRSWLEKYGIFSAVIALVVTLVITATFWERRAIRAYLWAKGCRLLRIKPGFLFAALERMRTRISNTVFKVTYATKAGEVRTGECEVDDGKVIWRTTQFPDEEKKSNKTGCVSCGLELTSDNARCPRCGWAYETDDSVGGSR